MTIELLQKLKENRCTDEELHQIYAWLCSSTDEEETTAFMKNSWQGVEYTAEVSAEDKASMARMRQEVWNIIESQSVEKDMNQSQGIPKQKHQPGQYFNWTKIAAAILLLMMVGGVFYGVRRATFDSEISNITYIEKSNPRGQKSTVFLKDGSKVILNSSSSIRYASNFGEANRDIELIGEAFFEVRENKNIPFNVRSGDITTQVLGTSFNINAYPGNKSIDVSLFTGKTKVFYNHSSRNHNQEGYILNPGQSLSFNPAMRLFEKGQFDSRKVLSWKDGILYFENEKFASVLEVLQEWYDVDILVDYGTADQSAYDGINGEFKNESLENVMRVMSHSRNFEYKISGKQMKIKFN